MGFGKALGTGLFFIATGWTLFIWGPTSPLWGLASVIGRGLGEGAETVTGAAVARLIRNESAGSAYAIYTLVTELSRSLAPVPGGALYGAAVDLPFALAAFANGVLGWLIFNSHTRPPVSSPNPAPRLQL